MRPPPTRPTPAPAPGGFQTVPHGAQAVPGEGHGVSPATLTRTVQRLAAIAGHRLPDRGPRGVSLTGQGHRFRDYAVRAVELWAAGS